MKTLFQKLVEMEQQPVHEDIQAFYKMIDNNRLVAIRKLINMSQDKVAKLLGASRKAVASWEQDGGEIPPGVRTAYSLFFKTATDKLGLEHAIMTFSFIDSLTVFSEWVDLGKPTLRYYVAQTKAKMFLDPENTEMDVNFGIFCSDGEISEPTGWDCATVAQAEDSLKKRGLQKIATYTSLTEEERNAEQEGAAASIQAILNKIRDFGNESR